MRDDPIDLDALLAQLSGLGRRDRRAVMMRLTQSERDRIDAAMTAQDEARHREVERVRRAGRQFAGYSPWLAELLQKACGNDDNDDRREKGEVPLSATARRAVADIHRAIHNEDAAAPPGLMAQVRDWAAALLSPRAGGSA